MLDDMNKSPILLVPDEKAIQATVNFTGLHKGTVLRDVKSEAQKKLIHEKKEVRTHSL